VGKGKKRENREKAPKGDGPLKDPSGGDLKKKGRQLFKDGNGKTGGREIEKKRSVVSPKMKKKNYFLLVGGVRFCATFPAGGKSPQKTLFSKKKNKKGCGGGGGGGKRRVAGR